MSDAGAEVAVSRRPVTATSFAAHVLMNEPSNWPLNAPVRAALRRVLFDDSTTNGMVEEVPPSPHTQNGHLMAESTQTTDETARLDANGLPVGSMHEDPFYDPLPVPCQAFRGGEFCDQCGWNDKAHSTRMNSSGPSGKHAQPEPTMDDATSERVANILGINLSPLPEQTTSTNPDAERIMGRRPSGVIPFDLPCELGFWCPVCKVAPGPYDGEYDERLQWSEYNAFLWCNVCDRDYPSALCVRLDAEKDPDRPWMYAGPEDAIGVYLSTVDSVLNECASGNSTDGGDA